MWLFIAFLFWKNLAASFMFVMQVFKIFQWRCFFMILNNDGIKIVKCIIIGRNVSYRRIVLETKKIAYKILKFVNLDRKNIIPECLQFESATGFWNWVLTGPCDLPMTSNPPPVTGAMTPRVTPMTPQMTWPLHPPPTSPKINTWTRGWNRLSHFRSNQTQLSRKNR